MPNCDFFAAGTDHKSVLEFVLSETECRVFELYSDFDSELKEFRTIGEFEDHYEIADWSTGPRTTLYLNLYPTKANGSFRVRRIDVGPNQRHGAAYRYASEGWGLVQLYLEIVRDGCLSNSHTNHNSEKRAGAWESTFPSLGSSAAWNWREVESYSRRLNRFIHKSAVGRIGSRRVLPFAAELQQRGIVLGNTNEPQAIERAV